MQYRLYHPDDFARLYAVEVACFQPAFRFGRSYMRHLLGSPQSVAWIAEEEGRITGFSILEWGRTASGIAAYIQTLEVLPAVRNRGVGNELLHRVEQSAVSAGAASVWLHVDPQNSGAVRLYERNGYLCQGRKENYYPHGRAALIYCKTLEPAPSSP